MEATKSREGQRLGRAAVVIAAMAFSGVVGATTIQTVVAYDPVACSQFLNMVKMAGVPDMSDAQLCDFRFERLPPAITKHFVAIAWKPLVVEDPVAMYRRMWQAHEIKGDANNLHPGPDLIRAAQQAAADHNLGFYTAQVQLQGKGPMITVVKMDVMRSCTIPPSYMMPIGLPFYALYKSSSLQEPLAIDPPPDDGEQMMLWKGKALRVPVLMNVDMYWLPPSIGDVPMVYFNQLTMNSLEPSGVKSGMYRDTVYSYGRCAYNLLSKTKPTGTKEMRKESMP